MNHELRIKGKKRSGQILILVLLVVVVALAVGLSVASRNLTNLKTSTQAEQSQRAFTAAEGGVEDVLSKLNAVANVMTQPVGTTTPDGCKNVSSTQANCNLQNATAANGVTGQVNVVASSTYTKTVDTGDVAQVNLNGATGSPTTFTVEWGTDADKSASETGSMEFAFICNSSTACNLSVNGGAAINSTVTGSYSQIRVAYKDPNDITHSGNQTGFSDCTNAANGYHCKISFALNTVTTPAPGAFLLLRMKPFWDRTTVKVTATSGSLPVQTYSITSVATTDTGVSRKVQVYRDALPQLPAVFDYVLYSGGDITK